MGARVYFRVPSGVLDHLSYCCFSYTIKVLGSVYTGPDLFGTGTKLVRISLMFAQDLVDTVRIGSAIWYRMGPLMKVQVSNRSRVNRVDPIPNGSEHIRSRVNAALVLRSFKDQGLQFL